MILILVIVEYEFESLHEVQLNPKYENANFHTNDSFKYENANFFFNEMLALKTKTKIKNKSSQQK